jgi:hypothetical protein
MKAFNPGQVGPLLSVTVAAMLVPDGRVPRVLVFLANLVDGPLSATGATDMRVVFIGSALNLRDNGQ